MWEPLIFFFVLCVVFLPKGKAITHPSDLEALLTRIFFFPIYTSSNSGEVRVSGLLRDWCSPLALEGSAAAGRPGRWRKTVRRGWGGGDGGGMGRRGGQRGRARATLELRRSPSPPAPEGWRRGWVPTQGRRRRRWERGGRRHGR